MKIETNASVLRKAHERIMDLEAVNADLVKCLAEIMRLEHAHYFKPLPDDSDTCDCGANFRAETHFRDGEGPDKSFRNHVFIKAQTAIIRAKDLREG